MYTKLKEIKSWNRDHRILYYMSFVTMKMLYIFSWLQGREMYTFKKLFQKVLMFAKSSQLYLHQKKCQWKLFDLSRRFFFFQCLNFYSKQLLSLYKKYLWCLPEVKVLCKTSWETWIIPFFKAFWFCCLEILAEKEFKGESRDTGDLHVNNEWSIEVTH